MNDFAMTKGGHEFLYSTMPTLAKNIKAQTEAINALTETIKGERDFSSLSAEEIVEKLTAQQKREVCDLLRIGYVRDDVASRFKTLFPFKNASEDLLFAIAKNYVSGRYDCNQSYWDNLDNLIKEAMNDDDL